MPHPDYTLCGDPGCGHFCHERCLDWPTERCSCCAPNNSSDSNSTLPRGFIGPLQTGMLLVLQPDGEKIMQLLQSRNVSPRLRYGGDMLHRLRHERLPEHALVTGEFDDVSSVLRGAMRELWLGSSIGCLRYQSHLLRHFLGDLFDWNRFRQMLVNDISASERGKFCISLGQGSR